MLKDKVKVFKLLELDELLKFERLIPQIIFDLPKKQEEYQFYIAPLSGWMYYSNEAEIQKNGKVYALPQNENETKEAVLRFLKRANERLDTERKRNPQFKIDELFPSEISNPKVFPVFNSESGELDHLLVRCEPELRGILGYRSSKMPVIGSVVDFRVGNGGNIIGVSSHWRPIERSFTVELLPEPISSETKHSSTTHEPLEEENAHHGSESVEVNSDPKSKYVLSYFDKGENIYMNYLIPFYCQVEGHHFHFHPASSSSMVIDIKEIHTDGNADLHAHVEGGSGRFIYDWASWKIENMEESYQELGRTRKISVGVGAYVVALVVKDERSGNVEQILKNVFVHYKIPEIEEPIA